MRQVAARLQAQHGDVRVAVRADELGVELALVGERHVDATRPQDHVLVGEDRAVGGDDHARAEARGREAARPRIEEVAEVLIEERILRRRER